MITSVGVVDGSLSIGTMILEYSHNNNITNCTSAKFHHYENEVSILNAQSPTTA